MNKSQQEACNNIRELDSGQAADWLIEHFRLENKSTGDVYKVLPHRSWARKDQIRLADYFLQNLPHRSDRGYKAFISFMSLPVFIEVIKRHLPSEDNHKQLLAYYLSPLLRSHPSSTKYQNEIDGLLKFLQA